MVRFLFQIYFLKIILFAYLINYFVTIGDNYYDKELPDLKSTDAKLSDSDSSDYENEKKKGKKWNYICIFNN